MKTFYTSYHTKISIVTLQGMTRWVAKELNLGMDRIDSVTIYRMKPSERTKAGRFQYYRASVKHTNDPIPRHGAIEIWLADSVRPFTYKIGKQVVDPRDEIECICVALAHELGHMQLNKPYHVEEKLLAVMERNVLDTFRKRPPKFAKKWLKHRHSFWARLFGWLR